MYCQSERLDDVEGETELDEYGNRVYRNRDYTGGRSNPSGWYEGGGAGAAGALFHTETPLACTWATWGAGLLWLWRTLGHAKDEGLAVGTCPVLPRGM